MPIINNRYIAPDPTPEQIANALLHNYDPYECCGKLPYWDFRPDDTLAAACVIHDEMCNLGGTEAMGIVVADNFKRDSLLLARAAAYWTSFEIVKAKTCGIIVRLLLNSYWHPHDLNTDTTRAQGAIFMAEAKTWINTVALQSGEPLPYP